jgi:hypothetical protein
MWRNSADSGQCIVHVEERADLLLAAVQYPNHEIEISVSSDSSADKLHVVHRSLFPAPEDL